MNALKKFWSCNVLVGAAVMLAACASPSPAPVLLTLPPSTPATAASASASDLPASAPLLAVRRVNIPEYLVARRVRYRSDTSTLAEWPNTYWAERIEIGVSREFASALRARLPGWSLCETNCGDLVPAFSLQVDLVPMDYLRSTQKLHAHARITLSTGTSPTVVKMQELTYELPGTADSAQSQAQAIAELIQKVAAVAAPMVSAAKQ